MPDSGSAESVPIVRRWPSDSNVRPPTEREFGTKSFWKRQARTWHWMSGAVCLVGLLMFAVTGITLNHASDIESSPSSSQSEGTLTPDLIVLLKDQPLDGTTVSLPPLITDWLSEELGVSASGRPVEWTDIDAYVGLPRPGGDAWLSIDRETGEVVYESTSRGAVAYLNDLHKGRNTGTAWFWFLDIFSVACVVFSLTGLWLLQIHAGKRASTWPLTVLGFVVPAVIALVFIH